MRAKLPRRPLRAADNRTPFAQRGTSEEGEGTGMRAKLPIDLCEPSTIGHPSPSEERAKREKERG